MKTPEEIFKENYFKLEDANEEDWNEAKKMGGDFHKCILDSISDFHNQFKNNKAVEISDKEIAHYWKRKNCTGTYLEGLIDGSIDMRDKQGVEPNKAVAFYDWIKNYQYKDSARTTKELYEQFLKEEDK